MFTASPKPVEPDRDEGVVHLETTRQPHSRGRCNSLDVVAGGFDTVSSQSEQAGSTSFRSSKP
ncbi:hypothetical protein EGT56_12630 [Arachnia propionica]|nr:hypothetical protein EGT56_12630 [Arachnia propionica]